MSFLKLYQYAAAKADQALGLPAAPGRPEPLAEDRAPVELKDIQARILQLGTVQEIVIHAADLNPEANLGHIKIVDLRECRYDDAELVARIRVHEDQTRCWFRFVVCKELMHTFDNEDEAVFDEARFKLLLKQLETAPLAGHESPIYTSEWDAEWMALLILCPYEHRNKWKALREADEVSDMDVALQFRVPKAIIPALFGDGYEEAYQLLIAKPQADLAAAEARPDPNEAPPALKVVGGTQQ